MTNKGRTSGESNKSVMKRVVEGQKESDKPFMDLEVTHMYEDGRAAAGAWDTTPPGRQSKRRKSVQGKRSTQLKPHVP